MVEVDGRQWAPIQKNVTAIRGKDFTVEYIPVGQSLDNWEEMVTVQFFAFNHAQQLVANNAGEKNSTGRPNSQTDITAQRFETIFLEGLRQGAAPGAKNKQGEKTYEFPPQTTVTSTTLQQSDDSVLFEWQAGKNADAQQELVRAIKGAEGLDVVHYTTKKKMTADQFDKWQKLLNEAHLEKLPRVPRS